MAIPTVEHEVNELMNKLPERYLVAGYRLDSGDDGILRTVATRLAQYVDEDALISGRAPGRVAASTVYLSRLLAMPGSEPSQEQIAEESGTSQRTVRKSYSDVAELARTRLERGEAIEGDRLDAFLLVRLRVFFRSGGHPAITGRLKDSLLNDLELVYDDQVDYETIVDDPEAGR